MNVDEDVFAGTTFGKIALKKMGKVDKNFRLYYAGWLEERPPFEIMKVTGALFRAAQRGPRVGQLCIKVPATEKTVYVTSKEMQTLQRKMKGVA